MLWDDFKKFGDDEPFGFNKLRDKPKFKRDSKWVGNRKPKFL